MVSSMVMLFLRYLRLLWKERVTNEGETGHEGTMVDDTRIRPARPVECDPPAQVPTDARPTHAWEDRTRLHLCRESGGRREGSHCRDGWLTKRRKRG